jgi:hypothetical protein
LGGHAGLGSPTVASLFQVGNPGELGHGLPRQIGQAEAHDLDARAAEFAGFQPRRRPLQPSLDAHCDLVRLRAIGRTEYIADFVMRAHLAMSAPGAGVNTDQIHPG